MLVIISGPSGIGKDTLIRGLVSRYGARFEIPYTSRRSRASERNGVDYHFVSRDEFRQGIRDRRFLEWDYCLDEYYGFGASLAPRDTELIVTHALARMALRIWARIWPLTRLVFLMPHDVGALRARLELRCGSDDELKARLAHGEEEMRHAPLFDYVMNVAGADEALAQHECEWREIFYVRGLT